MRFAGDVWAVPEGRIVHANEPILEVTAPIADAQLVETLLLNQVTLHTTLDVEGGEVRHRGRRPGTWWTSRSGGRTGSRRRVAAARGSAIVGFAATSNVEAAREFGLRVAGTMAHSFIEAFDDEARGVPRVRGGPPGPDHVPGRHVRHAERRAQRDRGDPRARDLTEEVGVRLDTRRPRPALARGAAHPRRGRARTARIFASGGLDEHEVAELVRAGAPVDAFGIGTQLGVSADAPYVDAVYKLVEYDGRPVLKLSPAKATRARAQAGLARTVGGRGRAPRRVGARPDRAAAGAGDAGRARLAPAPVDRGDARPVPTDLAGCP